MTPIFHPLTGWPEKLSSIRYPSPFSASYETTRKELDTEMRAHDALDVCIYLDVQAHQIRLDGQLRADARPGHPGVMFSFRPSEMPRDKIQLHCDTYTLWHDNLRAIVKTLNSLRAVERHGVLKRQEQYAGVKLAKIQSSPDALVASGALVSSASLFGSVREAICYLGFVSESAHWDLNPLDQAPIDLAIERARESASSPAQLRLVEAAIALIKGQ